MSNYINSHFIRKLSKLSDCFCFISYRYLINSPPSCQCVCAEDLKTKPVFGFHNLVTNGAPTAPMTYTLSLLDTRLITVESLALFTVQSIPRIGELRKLS